ncbi:MAG: transcriptional regulator [Firmicutes bacterium HGW-Firmicutes-14]|nr:MAG: transcriptional regulator [Firmicutes bacterium HGW-Firmicutes-14]
MMPKRKKRFSPWRLVFLMIIFTVSFFAGRFIADWGLAGPQAIADTEGEDNKAELPVNRLNVLLLGIDARPGEEDARTDTMILVSIDRETKKIAMVSIPRDTMVQIPGHGKNKINAANALGGAEMATETVEKLLDLDIPYYVKTNFDGFQEIVDTLGGVEIDVEKRMYYPAENINLRPGLQKLDGENALAYVRYRNDALGDISRAERQQKFLSALAKETLRARTIIKLPKLVPQLMDAVETNLGAGDALLLARVASNLDPDNIMTATLPGTFLNDKGVSYWKVDEDEAGTIVSKLFEGIKVATVTGPDINIPAEKPKADEEPEQTVQEDRALEDGVQGEDDTLPAGGTAGQGTTAPSGDSAQGGSSQTPSGGTVKPPADGSTGTGQTQPGGSTGTLPDDQEPDDQAPPDSSADPDSPAEPAEGTTTGGTTTPDVEIITQG